MSKAFSNKLALVTGASRGIGAAIAEVLARQGAHVVLAARTASDLEAVESRIFEAGGSATIAPLDLTDGDSIARLAAAIRERWDALDILVLNAAMLGGLSPVPAIDGKEFNKILTLNVLSSQAMIAAFDPMLRSSGNGRLLAITSSVGRNPRAFWGAYGASKAALETLLLSYADEVRNFNSPKIAIIDPGATATLMRAQAFPGEDQTTIKQPADVAEAVIELLATDFETGHRLEVRT